MQIRRFGRYKKQFYSQGGGQVGGAGRCPLSDIRALPCGPHDFLFLTPVDAEQERENQGLQGAYASGRDFSFQRRRPEKKRETAGGKWTNRGQSRPGKQEARARGRGGWKSCLCTRFYTLPSQPPSCIHTRTHMSLSTDTPHPCQWPVPWEAGPPPLPPPILLTLARGYARRLGWNKGPGDRPIRVCSFPAADLFMIII